MIKYLEGDFTIREIKVIEKFKIDNVNYVTQKITYDSNKVVYKTIHY